jgi:glycosyltransferase involved in cell wall biosynthesis
LSRVAPEISLILPCRNEERFLRSTLDEVGRFLASYGRSFEILVSDDSSTDASKAIAEDYARGHPEVRIIPGAPARGKGAALSRGFAAARGTYAAFLDADLEIPVENLRQLFAALDEGADIAIGSKSIGSTGRQRPFVRRMLTGCYTAWVKLMLGSRLGDHQAGAKALCMDRCRAVLGRVKSPGWSWDTEMLIYAQQEGLRIRECAVTTQRQDRASRLQVFRDSIRVGRDVVRLRRRGNRLRHK